MRASLVVAAGAMGVLVAMVGCATTAEANDKDCPTCPPRETEKCPEGPSKALDPLVAKADSVSAANPRTLKFRAFSHDHTHVAVEVSDDRGGSFLEIRKLADGKVVKMYRLDPASQKRVWKTARKRHKLRSRAPKTAAHPKDDALTLMGVDRAKWAVASLSKGERVVPYLTIPRLDNAGLPSRRWRSAPTKMGSWWSTRRP